MFFLKKYTQDTDIYYVNSTFFWMRSIAINPLIALKNIVIYDQIIVLHELYTLIFNFYHVRNYFLLKYHHLCCILDFTFQQWLI